jgi:hypothetical protein
MFSSPLVVNEKPNISRSPEQKFPTTNVKSVDAFDKLKRTENQLNESKANSKEELIIKDNSKDEKTSKEENNKKKQSDEEKSVTDSSSSSHHSTIFEKLTKDDVNVIKNYRNSFNGFEHMLSKVKNIK